MHSTRSRLLTASTGLWAPRILWAAVGLAGAWSVAQALDGRSAAARTAITILAWFAWGTGVVALVVPSTLGLTVMRMLSALACGAAIVSWVAGASPAAGAVFVACTLIAALSVGSADFGKQCVQSSAYGDEHRFLLRPPAAFLAPVAIAGVVWLATMLAAALLLAAQRWVIGAVAATIAMLLTLLVLPRFNALSRRWLVLVPAGVVVHDQIVLGETLMVSRSNLEGIELALEGTEAADFTGPAGGHAVEISVRSMVTAVLAPAKDSPRGQALHVQSLIVAPSRPGTLLAEFRYWSR
jgi:hypothetical protein